MQQDAALKVLNISWRDSSNKSCKNRTDHFQQNPQSADWKQVQAAQQRAVFVQNRISGNPTEKSSARLMCSYIRDMSIQDQLRINSAIILQGFRYFSNAI